MSSPGQRPVRAQKTKGSQGYDRHWVLVNRKTGKVASNNHWLLAQAAKAVQNQDITGLASLLPLGRAKKLLRANDIMEKKQRGQKSKIESVSARHQANQILTELIILYIAQLPKHLTGGRMHFANWVHREIGRQGSEVMKKVESRGFHELIDAQNCPRWWHDQLKKMQS